MNIYLKNNPSYIIKMFPHTILSNYKEIEESDFKIIANFMINN